MLHTSPIERIVRDRSDRDAFSGVVRIQRGRDVVLDIACGYANRSWRVANRSNTRFRVASISKLFTAVGVLQLIDDGVLAIDTPIVDYLELMETTIPRDVTIRHLLTMTAGIADWFEESGDWEANWAALCLAHPLHRFRGNADYVPLFASSLPLRPVGSAHAYNGASYILLGLAIERAASMSYFDFIRTRLFAPLKLARTDFFDLDDVHDDVAEGYVPADGSRWRTNVYTTTAGPAADGGATSTAEDLIRFSQAVRHGEGLSEPLTRQFHTPQVSESDDQVRGYAWAFGYGLTFISDQEGRIVRWGRTGEEDGASARLYYYPEQDLDLVILGNQSNCAGSLAWDIHEQLVSGA